MMIQGYVLVIISVLFNVIAQLLLKKGVTIFEKLDFSIDTMIKLFVGIFTNIYIFSGMFCFVMSAFLWLFVLTKIQVSIAYPLGSLGYIFTAVLAYFILNEPLTMAKIIGIALICVGVYVLTKANIS